MSTVTIECPECAGKVEVDEASFGQRIKCPKCKESFVAEKPGLYDFVEEPEPPPSSSPPPPAPPPRGGQASRGRPTKDEASDALSDEEKSELLSSMEKWAEE